MSSPTQKPSVHIGSVIRNARVFNPKNWDGNSVANDNLLQSVARLFAILHERQIDYLPVGGVALLQYVEGRNTEDIALIVAVSDLSRLPEIRLASQDAKFARGRFEDLQIDFLLTRNSLFERVRRQYATTQPFRERDIVCATVEGLLLLKLYALPSLYRQANFARVGIYENDVATLVQAYHPDLEPLFAELSRHLSASDLASVRQIMVEIQQRIDRYTKRID